MLFAISPESRRVVANRLMIRFVASDLRVLIEGLGEPPDQAVPFSKMKHETDFIAEEPSIEPYPGWLRALVWYSTFTFGALFWWGLMKLFLSVFAP